MLRIFILSCIGLSIHISLIAAEPKPWKTFESPDGRFSVSLPATPTPTEEKASSGVKLIAYTCDSVELDCRFRIGCAPLPMLKEGETIEKFFENRLVDFTGEESMLKLVDKKLYQWKDKFPAFDITFAFPKSEGKEVMVRYVTVATPKDVIGIQIMGAKSSIQGKHIASCLESLTIKE